ncbi:MAG: ABC transporter substrate-binding protein, partial [Sphingobium sp.]
AIIQDIVVEAPRTVVFKLASSSATFPLICASFNAPIVKVASLQSDADNPVGCGPFVLTGSERGAWIEMEAFADYYKPGLPGAKRLRFETMADENARMSALISGAVHMIEYVPASEMDNLAKNKEFTLASVEGPSTYLLFNVEKGPFKNPLVRQAVGYAINRMEVVEGAFGGRGSELTGLPIPKSSPFFSSDESLKWTYDPKKAQALLAEAGVGNGFECTLVTYNNSVHQNPAMVAQQHLAAVGINAQLNVVDWPTRVQIGNQGQYDIGIMANSGDSNDPDALKLMLQGDLGPSFYRSSGYNNAEINALLAKGRAETELEARKAIYTQIQKISKDDPAIVPLCWRDQAYGWSNKVKGFANLPGFLTFYSGIMLEEVRFV